MCGLLYLYSSEIEKSSSRKTPLEVWRIKLSFDDLDILSSELMIACPSSWMVYGSPGGKWRADSRLVLVLPALPSSRSARPVKILKGEMTMFSLGPSRVTNRSVRNSLDALTHTVDIREILKKVNKKSERRTNSIISFLRPQILLKAFVSENNGNDTKPPV